MMLGWTVLGCTMLDTKVRVSGQVVPAYQGSAVGITSSNRVAVIAALADRSQRKYVEMLAARGINEQVSEGSNRSVAVPSYVLATQWDRMGGSTQLMSAFMAKLRNDFDRVIIISLRLSVPPDSTSPVGRLSVAQYLLQEWRTTVGPFSQFGQSLHIAATLFVLPDGKPIWHGDAETVQNAAGEPNWQRWFPQLIKHWQTVGILRAFDDE